MHCHHPHTLLNSYLFHPFVLIPSKHQEDEYTCFDGLSNNNGPAFFAVFDGHGTDDYSAHLKSIFLSFVSISIQFDY